MANYQYPQGILPKATYKQEVNPSAIIGHQPLALLGHMLIGSETDCIDYSLGADMPAIYQEALQVKRIPNLSCSLMGCYFCIDDFHFLPQNKGKEPWIDDCQVEDGLLENKENYDYYAEITVVGWILANIHLHPIPYKRLFGKKDEYENFAKKVRDVAENRRIDVYLSEWDELKARANNNGLSEVEVTGQARVNHAPTNLNYWHFTIDFYSAEDDMKPQMNISSAWRNNMALNLWDYLRHNFEILKSEEQIQKITDQSLWIKFRQYETK